MAVANDQVVASGMRREAELRSGRGRVGSQDVRALLGLPRSGRRGRRCVVTSRCVSRPGTRRPGLGLPAPAGAAVGGGAETREGWQCRNNSHGLLLGCWVREHKWQRLKQAFLPKRWGDLARSLLGSVKDCLATVSVLIAIVTAAAAVIGHL